MKLHTRLPVVVTLLLGVLLTYALASNDASARPLAEGSAETARADYGLTVGDGMTPSSTPWPAITFDSAAVTYTLTGFGGAEDSTVVVDPTNAANNVAKVVKSATAQLWAGTTVSTGPNNTVPVLLFTASNTTVTVRVWSPDAGIQVRLKAEDAADGSKSVETEATTTVAAAWETLTFDFANPVAGTPPLNLAYTYNRVSIFFNFGVPGSVAGAKTYYFDDVTFNGETTPPPITWDTITFDSAAVTYTLTGFGGAEDSTVVVDPTNAANNVARVVKSATAELWAGTTVSTGPNLSVPPLPFTADDTTMSVRVWSPDAGIQVRLKVEDAADGSKSVETEATTTAAGAWETLVFDFANPAAGTQPLNLAYTYSKISIFFNFGVPGSTAGAKTYYFDDVAFGGTPPPPATWPTITFDSAAVIYTLTGFGGAEDSTVVVDPTNAANNVARVVKSATAELWAGTTVSTGPNLSVPPLPFTADDTTMSVRVWSPDAGIQVRLKVEDAADGSKSVETEATTTAAGAWETLVFDFANPAAGTQPLNLAYTYSKISIFFNFGVPGSVAGAKTYYFDDVAFGGTPPPPATWPTITFDSAAVTYTLTGFGGAEDSTVVVDPTNAANNVARVVKSATAELWAGTTVSTGPNLSVPPLPFTADDTTMSVRVWSPDAGIQVRLKAEDAADGSRSVETEATTTAAGAWETLVFDFANPAAGTQPLNLAYTYSKISIFFNFGVPGAAVGAKTYYFDDVAFGGAQPPSPSSGKVVVIDDFENGLPTGTDANGIGIGFVTWGDTWNGTMVAIETATTAAAGIDPVPGKSADNQVINLESKVVGWGGFTHAFENAAVDTWVSQDWSAYEGIAFWYHGTGTGTVVFVDVAENRNPGSTTDDAERWSYEWVDNMAGWQFVAIPFGDLNRKDIGNGAPNDGWTGEEVHGWALGTVSTGGRTEDRYVDEFGLLVRVTVVDDFENGLPTGTDANGLGIGFVTWGDTWNGTTVAITTTTTGGAGLPAVPGQSDANQVINLRSQVVGWGGFTHAFENETADVWLSQDWSTYEGICFWYYGTGTGTVVFVDVAENRNPGSTTDDAERWSYEWTDNATGWQLIEIPFTALTRKDIGNGAPNDGWTGDDVHGWALGTVGTGGRTENRYVDDFATYGNLGGAVQELRLTFAAPTYQVQEGATAVLTVTLNMTATFPVSVDYATAEGYATPDRDYTPVNGTLTIPAGELTQSFTIATLPDTKREGNENLMVVLSNPVGVDFGFQRRAMLTIQDDDAADPALVHDFEGFHSFLHSSGDVTFAITELMASAANARPGQDPYESVLTVTNNGPAHFHEAFVQGRDWSGYDGLSFWYYGRKSGRTITVELLDNRAATTAATPADDWVMVWNDEFDGSAGTPPNPNNWKHEVGDGTLNGIPGWGNSESQYYTDNPDNAALDGSGNLAITMFEEDVNTTDRLCWYGPCMYTSARLISADRMAYEYGRIETRLKVPNGPGGLWPAFWMLGTNIGEVGWPQSGEIDVMEYVSRIPNEIFGTIHGPGYSGGQSFGNTYDFGVPVADAYHTYAVEWSPNKIDWYVDDILYHSAAPADVAPNAWTFNHPFYLIYNMAIGGNFGGSISPDIIFPQTMLVDYVRVYQAADTAERFEAGFQDNFGGWRHISLPFRSFTRSADQPAGAPNDGLTLSEVWGYGMRLPEGSGRFHMDWVYLDTYNQYYLPMIWR